jgi:NTE family protein
MTTAFVLSGGASLGAVQVGMLQALTDAGVRPDVVVGTSVGAVNAVWIAESMDGPRLEQLESLWTALRRSDVFPTGARSVLGLLGRRAAIVDPAPLRRFLGRHLSIERLENAATPVHVVVTDVLSGRDVLLSRGLVLDAVLASASIPGVFPPVVVDGRVCMDGGVVNNAAVTHAIALGATTVYVLPTGWSCSLGDVPKNALGMALHGLTVLIQHRLADDVEHYSDSVDIRVVPPPCPIRVGPADFSQARALIDDGRAVAARWLEHGAPVDIGKLRPHEHPPRDGRRATVMS